MSVPTVTFLDGTPVRSVTKGWDYLVPCVYGIPVICPSHIDTGNQGDTGRHWHTDDRFGNVGRDMRYWSEVDQKDMGMMPGDSCRASIIRDNGEPIVMEKMTAEKSEMWPSGGVFSSVCWLYERLGTQPAIDGMCRHHRTPLVEQDGCLECPAHGLKYKMNGSIRYKPPYWIATRYIDHDHNIHQVREPLVTGKDGVVLKVNGNFDPFPVIRLEDDNGDVIIECKSDTMVRKSPDGIDHHTLTLSIGAWPLDGKCPSLAPCDPREKK